ncbi:MAG TPA: response regulator [Candidatus Binatia bacterium]|nr:response regulator [Candidatus Binatia bacterium]
MTKHDVTAWSILEKKPSSISKIPASENGTIYAHLHCVGWDKKILVVEDNEEQRELLLKILNHFGYDVMEAASGIAAINQASEAHPDIILMDVYLPEMTGDEITARLKANPATRHIPVIITGAFPVQDEIHARFAGAAEILQKPFSLTTLKEILDRYLSTDESKETCCG